jgi:hypothetical protein
VERVKWYAPHIRHLVLDVECRPDKASAQQLLSSESPVMTAPCMDDGADEKLTAPPPTQIPVPQGLYLSPGVLFAHSNNLLTLLERTSNEGAVTQRTKRLVPVNGVSVCCFEESLSFAICRLISGNLRCCCKNLSLRHPNDCLSQARKPAQQTALQRQMAVMQQ